LNRASTGISFLVVFCSQFLLADLALATPTSKQKVPVPQSTSRTMELRDALRASDFSLEDSASSKVFKNNIEELKRLIEAESEPYELRWRSVLALAVAQTSEAVKYLKGLIASKEWFLRDSALKALTVVDKRAAIIVARKLVSDPSLIVRTSAVISLKKLGDKESVPLLWEKLEAKENFNKNESLFVRRHIVEALVVLDDKSPKAKFEHLLKDKDSRLHSAVKRKLSQLRSGDSIRADEPSTAL